tara:strand:- start:13616 stop:14647 length:1032 start_codon:yes stop_codon:yes gene_type:complete
MNQKNNILLISPIAPPDGGMSTLAKSIIYGLKNNGYNVDILNTNKFLGFVSNIYVLKIFQFFYYMRSLLFKISKSKLIFIISSSGNYYYFKAIPALITSKILRKKIIINFVGGALNEKSFIFKSINFFDKIIVPTNYMKNLFLKSGIQVSKYPNMVNTEKFKSKTKIENFKILCAKSLTKYSNVKSLVIAFQKIKKKIPDAVLEIAGNGPEKENLLNYINKNNIKDVRFLGNVNHSEMPNTLMNSDIFFHGTKYESFGIVLIEAMAAGVPVISSNVGGISELIINNKNGILVEYDNSESFARNALELYNNNSLRNLIIANGFKTSENYSVKNLISGFIKIIEK